jgi:hypothetical protein
MQNDKIIKENKQKKKKKTLNNINFSKLWLGSSDRKCYKNNNFEAEFPINQTSKAETRKKINYTKGSKKKY